ncbi:MAG: MOSC domain-containing protein [Pseudomonadota bacterium]
MGKLLSIARKAKTHAPMEELARSHVTRANGVEGDFRGRIEGARERQVTVLSADVWAKVCHELTTEVPWTARRANLLVGGIELPRESGQRITIGGLELEVTQETEPCTRMDQAHQGLRQALMPDWRGGVCCRVLNDAEIAVGDPVAVVPGPTT